MTDAIRRKHEAQVAYTKEKQGNFPYLFQSIQSNLRISDVDALFAALDEAQKKVDRIKEKVEKEISHAISGGYCIEPIELQEIISDEVERGEDETRDVR